MPERFGLGVALVVVGNSVLRGCIFTPDDLAVTDPAALAGIVRLAEAQPLGATTAPWQVVTLSAFFDPFATVGEVPWAFQPNAYSGSGFVVSAELVRTLGLSAEHCAPRRTSGRGEYRRSRPNDWEVWFPGWGREDEDGRWKRIIPHRPSSRFSARSVGGQVEFGPCGTGTDGKPAGKRHRGRMWRGDFVDLLSLAYALDADDGASFAEHREDFGLPPVELPLSVSVDEAGAAQMVEAAHALHGLALVLDEEAGGWFTTPQDRRERRGRIDLARTVSPAALAAQIPARFGLRAPLALRVHDEEHRRWAEAFHGGWNEADPRLLGVPFDAVSADVSSCYPLVAHRLGWWDLMTAEHIRRDDVTETLRRVCERAASDPTAVLVEPGLWQRFGATLVEVVPDGERLPVSVEDVRRPDGRMEVVALRSPERSMFFAWPDVVAAGVLSRRAPRIISATRYTPIGRQAKMRRRVPLLPGVVVHAEHDPALTLVRHRRKIKGRDYRLAADLRVMVNSLVYGNPSRFDDVWRYDRRTRRTNLVERPGPWNFFPIASSVAAGARLLLAVLDRQVSDIGGIIAYRDTDSAVIPATPDGGTLDLADGSSVRSLPWAEVDDVLGTFAPLSLGRDWPVWKTEREREGAPLRAVAFALKKHATTAHGQLVASTADAEDDDDRELVDATQANLGRTFADPPAMRGRVQPVDGHRRGSMAAVMREVRYAEARATDPGALRPGAPWDETPGAEGEAIEGKAPIPFPALRPYIVKTPAMARALPACLGAGPGTRYLEASVRIQYIGTDTTAVALDPGGDLADWQRFDWREKPTGTPLRLTTDPDDPGWLSAQPSVALAETLDAKGVTWAARSLGEHIEAVTVDPLLVRRVGRVSGVYSAVADGLPGDPGRYRATYGDADRLRAVQVAVREIGPRAFARVTGLAVRVAERAALGKRISNANVTRALRTLPKLAEKVPCCPVDARPVLRADGIYCSTRCRETAKKRRQRAKERKG
jgi:hypothetical protein